MVMYLAALTVMARNWKHLTTLQAAGMRRFSDEGIMQLAAGCPCKCPTLSVTHICLWNSCHLVLLVDCLCPVLTSLNIGACLHVSDAGIGAVAASCRSLTELVMASCSTVTDAALASLAKFVAPPHL